jgi:hypothetical protein
MILMHGDRASERRGLQNHRGRERYPDRAPFKMQRIQEVLKELYTEDASHCSLTQWDEWRDRVSLCSDIHKIPKVINAGEIIDKEGTSCQVMHNGVLIHTGCFHQTGMTNLIQALKGHAGPQEDTLFHQALNYIGAGGTMIEVGSFWAYYSLWFNKRISKAKNIMIEPVPLKLEIGQLNFELNNFAGEFINGYIGDSYNASSLFRDDVAHMSHTIPQLSIDWLMDKYALDSLDILHANIVDQLIRAEHPDYDIPLLLGAEKSLKSNKINFIFLSVRENWQTAPIIEKLKSYDYHILEEFHANESFWNDGLVLACSSRVINKLDIKGFKVSKFKQ